MEAAKASCIAWAMAPAFPPHVFLEEIITTEKRFAQSRAHRSQIVRTVYAATPNAPLANSFTFAAIKSRTRRKLAVESAPPSETGLAMSHL